MPFPRSKSTFWHFLCISESKLTWILYRTLDHLASRTSPVGSTQAVAVLSCGHRPGSSYKQYWLKRRERPISALAGLHPLRPWLPHGCPESPSNTTGKEDGANSSHWKTERGKVKRYITNPSCPLSPVPVLRRGCLIQPLWKNPPIMHPFLCALPLPFGSPLWCPGITPFNKVLTWTLHLFFCF